MRNLRSVLILPLSFSLVSVIMRIEGCEALSEEEKYELKGPKYPLQYLPIIDEINLESAFTKSHYMKFLMKCVFFEGPCDMMGKWLKPRALAALFGTCLKCTENQQEKMEGWLLSLIHHNKELFRVAMIKVCVDMNLKIPEEERNLIVPFLKETRQARRYRRR